MDQACKRMSGKIYDYFKPKMVENPLTISNIHLGHGNDIHIDDKNEIERDDLTSHHLHSEELTNVKKRKRMDDGSGNSPRRRRSDEPLFNLNDFKEAKLTLLNKVNCMEKTLEKEDELKKDFHKSTNTSVIPATTLNDLQIVKGRESELENDDTQKDREDKSMENMQNGDKESKKQLENGDAEADESSEENEDEEEDYDVEEIINYSKGKYLVKWAGWESIHNTWEPQENLNCREKLIDFYNRRVDQRNKAQDPKEKRGLHLPPDPRNSEDLKQNFISTHFVKPSQQTLEKLYQKTRKKEPKMMPNNSYEKEIKFLSSVNINKYKRRFEDLIMQFQLRELDKYRKKQIKQLKSWEERINAMEKDDERVSVMNDVDLEGPPTTMAYINSYKAGEGIIIPDDPPLGCDCETCTPSCANCCPDLAGVEMAYNSYGKLKLEIGQAIYECNKRCNCPPNCKNRVVQNGRKSKLAIYRTDNGCGWGVKTLEKIKRGSFVVEYVGEVITSEEAERRGEKYDAAGRTYLFDLDFNRGEDNLYTVDAASHGNLSHFINHACDPNLSIFNVYINCYDLDLPQLCLFARRDIQKGEQLTFDYCQSTATDDGSGSPIKSPSKTKLTDSKSSTPGKASDDGASGGSKRGNSHNTRCRCGSSNCRTWLF